MRMSGVTRVVRVICAMNPMRLTHGAVCTQVARGGGVARMREGRRSRRLRRNSMSSEPAVDVGEKLVELLGRHGSWPRRQSIAARRVG